jgi:hypothetical protein
MRKDNTGVMTQVLSIKIEIYIGVAYIMERSGQSHRATGVLVEGSEAGQ